MKLKIKKPIRLCTIIFSVLLTIPLVVAQRQVIEFDTIKSVAVFLHLIELFLAVFISFMALKFFQITRPINLFLVVYVAGGFFVISSLLYLVFYMTGLFNDVSFINVYIGSRISLIAMLISLGFLFFNMHTSIKRHHGS